jgi:AsmA protein
MTGTLSDGVLRDDQLLAQIPFLRLTGKGALNLVTRNMDYALQAQVFENPVFEDGSSIKDLKGLAIPLTVKGPFEQPKVSVDIKNMVAGAAVQKLKDRLFKRLGGADEPAAADGASATPPATPAAPGSEPPPASTPQQEEKPRDVLKRSLRDLLRQPQPAPESPQP